MRRLGSALLISSIVAQSAFAVCTKWASKKVGALDTRSVSEASGLIQSRGMLIWSNDSAGAAALYGSGEDGRITRTVNVRNFSNRDFEALALGPCLDNRGERCIYIGDIGDGIGWRSTFKIGVFKEADFWNLSTIAPVATISYSYPRGDENSEALLVTPDARVIVLSKNDRGVSEIYEVEASARVTHLGTVNLNAVVGPARGESPRITDASLSADGQRLLLLTYGDIVEVKADLVFRPQRGAWKKDVDFTVAKGPGLPQQETITYTGADSFIVSTEIADGRTADIYAYSCDGR
jgi:hypothetical protein